MCNMISIYIYIYLYNIRICFLQLLKQGRQLWQVEAASLEALSINLPATLAFEAAASSHSNCSHSDWRNLKEPGSETLKLWLQTNETLPFKANVICKGNEDGWTVRRLLASTGGEWRAALFFIGLSIKAESAKRTGRGTGSLTFNDGHGENWMGFLHHDPRCSFDAGNPQRESVLSHCGYNISIALSMPEVGMLWLQDSNSSDNSSSLAEV